MSSSHISFATLAAKTIVAHSITYVFMGVLASWALDYRHQFAEPQTATAMRQFDDPMIIAGPLLQPIRGLIFALTFYPLQECFFQRRYGWLILAWTLIALGVLATFGPDSGSLEGLVYTTIPIRKQLSGWLEVIPQAVMLSGLLYYWVSRPQKRWLTWSLAVIFLLLNALLLMGLFVKA